MQVILQERKKKKSFFRKSGVVASIVFCLIVAAAMLLGELISPPDKKKVLEPSSAHQIFGRAGRPQFDSEGYVFVLAHEDDVKIARWKQKFEQIPEGIKDPGLLKARKALKRKSPGVHHEQAFWDAGAGAVVGIDEVGRTEVLPHQFHDAPPASCRPIADPGTKPGRQFPSP